MTRVADISEIGLVARRKHAALWEKAWSQLSDAETHGVVDEIRLDAAKYYYGVLNPEDLVNETIASGLSGRRAWKDGLSLTDNLLLNLTSIANNELRKSRRLVSFEHWSETMPFRADTPTPLQILEANEEELCMHEKIRLATADAPLLSRIVDHVVELGEWKPRQLAVELNIEPKTLYSQKRRLQRRFGFLGSQKSRRV